MTVTPLTNDTEGVQAAIALAGPGGVIEFGAGVYTLTTPELSGVADQTWVGVPGQTVLRQATPPLAGEDMIFFNGQNNLRFYGIIFDGNGKLGIAGHHPGAQPALHLSGCSGVDISKCEFEGFYNCGLFANIISDIRIRNNRVSRGSATNQISSGISVSGGIGADISKRVWIENNFVEFCNINAMSADTFITGNDVSKWGFSAGINTQAISGSARNVITGNHIHESNWAPDVSPYDLGGIENWALDSVIANNIVHGCYGNGIDNGGSNCAVTGNVVFGNRNSGIFLLRQDATYNASGCFVSGNKCYGNGRYGIEEQAGSGLGNLEVGPNGLKNNTLGRIKLYAGVMTPAF